MTKKQIEKKYNVKCVKEINPYMQGREFWSIRNENGNEIERGETLQDVVNKLDERNIESN